MKTCATCSTEKPYEQSVKSKSRPDGYHPYCKECHNVRSRAWCAANAERRKQIVLKSEIPRREVKQVKSRERYFSNLDYERRRGALRRLNYPEENRIRNARWARERPDLRNATTARRRAQKKLATPAWADHWMMTEFYHIAALRTRSTGVKWCVDHIVPLQSDIVCGLHVHQNMAVITDKQNKTKLNYRWPDMP